MRTRSPKIYLTIKEVRRNGFGLPKFMNFKFWIRGMGDLLLLLVKVDVF